MNPVKIYTDPSHYLNSRRGYLHPLLKPFIGKPNRFSDGDRRQMYGLDSNDFSIVENPAHATIAILPMSWNFYWQRRKLDWAYSFYEKCRKKGLKVFSWVSGDFGSKVPALEHLIVHRTSGYRSKLPSNHRGMPVFISDPLKKWYARNSIFLRSKTERPVVGFCGQARGTWSKYVWDVMRTSWRNFKYYTHLTHEEPQSLYPSTLLRANVLKILERDERVATNFIKRKKYRAGVLTEEDRRKTTLEFYDNMIQADYIVCVRGGGNFSVRLYETLAMGRIPLFVNTDCLLPLADGVDWGKYVARVDRKNVNLIGDVLSEFHNSTTKDCFNEKQYQNRVLWMNKLQLKGFFEEEVKFCYEGDW